VYECVCDRVMLVYVCVLYRAQNYASLFLVFGLLYRVGTEFRVLLVVHIDNIS